MNFLNDKFDFVDYQSDKKIVFPIKINPTIVKKNIGHRKKNLEMRDSFISFMKDILAEGRSIIEKDFKKNNKGLVCVASQSHLMDQTIKILFEKYKYLNVSQDLSLIAIGGFGRRELAPFSDIDLLFLVGHKKNKNRDKLINTILYSLWDLNLKVGYSTRTINQTLKDIKKDLNFRTSILDQRHIVGSKNFFQKLKKEFKRIQKNTSSEFVTLKLKEQEQRHKNKVNSIYMLEKNIKESKGCLRDLNTMFWILKYRYRVSNILEIKTFDQSLLAEIRKLYKALDFLIMLRCHLHYISGKDNNFLDFTAQEEIALDLKYRNNSNSLSVERFMKRFYLFVKDVGSLTRKFCNDVSHFNNTKSIYSSTTHKKTWNRKNFELVDGLVYFNPNDTKRKIEPNDILDIFKFSQNKKLKIHPSTIYKIEISKRGVTLLKENKELNNKFIDILLSSKNSEETLRIMSETGILGQLIPDFQKIIGLIQFNMYHHYTVDEHTFRAIGFLHKLEKGDLLEIAPIATKLIKTIQSKKVLYIATLLHDIGKGRDRDHSIIGEELSKKICSQFQIKDEEIENILWLVRNHLLMSKVAFNYDISNPKTITDFTKLVQSPERLKLLLILTVSDILAVGPGIWNSWKASLMRDLFRHSEEILYGADPNQLLELNPEKSKVNIKQKLIDWKQEEFNNYSNYYPKNYWSSIDVETHVWLAKITKQNISNNKLINLNYKILKNTESALLVIMAPDHSGLFSDIAGAITIQQVEIQTAKIFTRKDGIAIDLFWVSPGKRIVLNQEKLDKIEKSVIQSLFNGFDPEKKIVQLSEGTRKNVKSSKVISRVIIDNNISNSHTIIEVNGKNKPGLLYKLTNEIKNLGLQTQYASVSTFGNRVVDVFYVKDIFGMKVDSKKRENLIKEKINSIL